MKILITGSSGMLGTDLVEVLSQSFDVYGISRHPQTFQSPRFTPVLADLENEQQISEIFNRIKPDIVIHTAAFTKVDLCEDEKWQSTAKLQNVDIAKRVIHQGNRCGAFLIFFSTDYVFSGEKKSPYVEEDPLEPLNFYGQTKAWAEQAFYEEALNYIIFRVTWLYGRCGNHFPRAILQQALTKDEIAVVSDQWGRPTWTHDIALGLKALLISRKNLLDRYNKQIFHIGNAGEVNWSGYARTLLDLKGLARVRVREILSSELRRPAKRPMNSVLNLDKARNCLGFELRPWNEALAEFVGVECKE